MTDLYRVTQLICLIFFAGVSITSHFYDGTKIDLKKNFEQSCIHLLIKS